METFKLWFEKDSEIPRFKRLAIALAMGICRAAAIRTARTYTHSVRFGQRGWRPLRCVPEQRSPRQLDGGRSR